MWTRTVGTGRGWDGAATEANPVGWSGDEDRNNGELGRGQVLVSCSSLIHACRRLWIGAYGYAP